MERYYAIFYPMEDEWGVRFPDAPSVNTSGKDIDEALEMAINGYGRIKRHDGFWAQRA